MLVCVWCFLVFSCFATLYPGIIFFKLFSVQCSHGLLKKPWVAVVAVQIKTLSQITIGTSLRSVKPAKLCCCLLSPWMYLKTNSSCRLSFYYPEPFISPPFPQSAFSYLSKWHFLTNNMDYWSISHYCNKCLWLNTYKGKRCV